MQGPLLVALCVLLVTHVTCVRVITGAAPNKPHCPARPCKHDSDCNNWGNCTNCSSSSGFCVLASFCGASCDSNGAITSLVSFLGPALISLRLQMTALAPATLALMAIVCPGAIIFCRLFFFFSFLLTLYQQQLQLWTCLQFQCRVRRLVPGLLWCRPMPWVRFTPLN